MVTHSAIGCDPRRDLRRIYDAAIEGVTPLRLVAEALEGRVAGSEQVPAMLIAASRIFLLAVGKAARGFAWALAGRCQSKLEAALAVVPAAAEHGPSQVTGQHERAASAPPPGVSVLEASHPFPDATSERAARAALSMLGQAGAGDLVIVALSGGASAMFALPQPGISLGDKAAVSRALMRSGASVRELNVVRKHLSAVKGGRLLRAIGGARVLGLILSDVSGNELGTIGSGLTAADPSTYSDAIAVLKRRGLWGRAPQPVREHLELGGAGKIDETLKPGDPLLARVTNLLIGDNATALAAAAKAGCELGYSVDYWRELSGEADEVGRALAAHLAAITTERLCVLAGGEPVVTVRGQGRGGRAQQAALAMAIELDRIGRGRRIAALFAGTDGIDGPTDAAGAFVTADTLERAAGLGLDGPRLLKGNDSYRFFEGLGDLLVTGPTGTNVADIFIGLANY